MSSTPRSFGDRFTPNRNRATIPYQWLSRSYETKRHVIPKQFNTDNTQASLSPYRLTRFSHCREQQHQRQYQREHITHGKDLPPHRIQLRIPRSSVHLRCSYSHDARVVLTVALRSHSCSAFSCFADALFLTANSLSTNALPDTHTTR